MMKRTLIPIVILSVSMLAGCGKDVTAEADSVEPTTVESVEAPVPEESETKPETESESQPETETKTEPEEEPKENTSQPSAVEFQSETSDTIAGTWTQTEEDEEITALNFNSNGTYTYTFDYSRAYEEGEEIDEDPVSGESEPFKYFLDTEYVMELEDTVLTMINMTMDENLSAYGNCGIYDSAANAIYIGESFNNLLARFVQQEHTTQQEWLDYIDNEYYLTFVR